MSEKGIFSEAQEKFLAEKLDNVVKLKGLLEIIDGMVFQAIISFVDNTYADKIQAEIKEKLAVLTDAVIAGKYDEAEVVAADIINSLVDIPGIDEEAEGLLFKGAINILVAVLLRFIESKKDAPIKLKLR